MEVSKNMEQLSADAIALSDAILKEYRERLSPDKFQEMLDLILERSKDCTDNFRGAPQLSLGAGVVCASWLFASVINMANQVLEKKAPTTEEES